MDHYLTSKTLMKPKKNATSRQRRYDLTELSPFSPSKPLSIREDVNKRGGGCGGDRGDDDQHENDAVRRQIAVKAVHRLLELVEVVLQGAAASSLILDPAAETQTSRCEIESQ